MRNTKIMSKYTFRAYDKLEKDYIYFDLFSGISAVCDQQYLILNISEIERFDYTTKEWVKL